MALCVLRDYDDATLTHFKDVVMLVPRQPLKQVRLTHSVSPTKCMESVKRTLHVLGRVRLSMRLQESRKAKTSHYVDYPLRPALHPAYSFMKRWLWVQFPWMSLSASGVSLLSEAAAAATATAQGGGLGSGIGGSTFGRGDGKGDAPGKSRRREGPLILHLLQRFATKLSPTVASFNPSTGPGDACIANVFQRSGSLVP